MNASTLLTADAVINLLMGVVLAVFPSSLISALGIPEAGVAFYPSILGAVLFGVGLALLIERVRGSSGLGLSGAISINLSGGLVLALWLLSGALALPLRGVVLLWALVVVLLGISGFELAAEVREHGRRADESPVRN